MKVLPSIVVLLAGGGLVHADENPEPVEADAVQSAIARSLPFLAKDGRDWMDGKVEMQDGKKCVSCHYVAFGVWSHEAASLAGVAIDKAKVAKLNADAIDFVNDPKVGRLVTYSHMILANHKPSAAAVKQLDDFALRIAKLQEPAGYWKARGQFPSQDRELMESNAVASMWALAATKPFEKDAAIAKARKKAMAWLSASDTGVSAEWHAWRLIVAHLEKEQDSGGRREALLKLQKPDGGWSWLKGKPSDAYTTGQALYALLTTGTRTDDDSANRAVRFLLSSQLEDGTWKVPSELVSAGPDENKDRIYSYWGTAWAVIALSRTNAKVVAAK